MFYGNQLFEKTTERRRKINETEDGHSEGPCKPYMTQPYDTPTHRLKESRLFGTDKRDWQLCHSKDITAQRNDYIRLPIPLVHYNILNNNIIIIFKKNKRRLLN